ncbi:MAG TPA: Co2+/Mg2+ efflux protein ApaG, partial [Myxococcota bacterium]|nr:Co2+/Mg2+ efflux protein ApaG [Myxococcota bacterium]
MSRASTEGVEVEVQSRYLPERSNPLRSQWFFTYHVSIRNAGTRTVQLLTRHWIITNAKGEIEEVKGPGVVGETPVLAPGDRFSYQSFCPLDTPIGSMHGSYQMVALDGSND